MSDPTEPRDDSDCLKACPFCGGEADWHENNGAPNNMDDVQAGGVWIECDQCGASTNMRYSLMEDCRPLLMEQWNRRASNPDSVSDSGACSHGDKFIVNNCLRCGAPVCCGRCCAEDSQEATKTRVSILDVAAYAQERANAELNELCGGIAYELTKRLVIDMPTTRAVVDDAIRASTTSKDEGAE